MAMEHLIAVARGDQPADLLLRNGKIVNVYSGEILARLALPIAGLMSPQPIRSIQAQQTDLTRAAGQLGTALADPFMTLSFLALPVIPELKLTDMGLVDVNRFEQVDLFLQ